MVYQNDKAIAMSSASSAGESQEIYSTEETAIGKWVDGRPIYRKVLISTLPSNADNKEVAHGIQNIDIVVSAVGSGVNSSGYFVNYPYSDPEGKVTMVSLTKTKLYLFTNVPSRMGTEVTVVVLYVKTTDTASVQTVSAGSLTAMPAPASSAKIL